MSQKITSRQKKKFDALEIEILFLMYNMKIIFHSYIGIFLNEHLRLNLNRFYKIASTCRKFHILQNGLQIDKILNFLYFKLMKPKEILVHYHIMHVIIIIHKTSNVKVDLNKKLTLLTSNILIT
jgi:hypothetical protein